MKILLAAALATLLASASSAHAQAYPAKPIRMIVPYTPPISGGDDFVWVGAPLEGFGFAFVV